MPALVPGVIDIPLGVLNQTPSDTQGVLGRLKQLINAQVRHYEGQQINGSGQTIPSKLKVEPRDPFVSLATTARNVADGTTASIGWSNPELLSSLGDQLVSICDSAPRVWNGSAWSAYESTAVIPHPLSQRVFHTSQQVIEASDSAYLNGVTCFVETQTSGGTAPLTTSYVGFRGDDGATVVTTNVLYASTSAAFVTHAKVVTDGSHFFVFYNSDVSSSNVINVYCYDTNGALLATNSIGTHSGIWDVIASPTGSPNTGTVLFAQASSATANSGVFLTSVGFSAPSTVTLHSTLDNSIQCAGPLAFITNNTGNGLAYLETGKLVTVGGHDRYRIFAYEISALAQVHEFDTGSQTTLVKSLDTLTGFAVGASNTTLVLAVGILPNLTFPAASGPPVDPALRFINSLSVDRSNAVVQLRTTQSLCQVSRAFLIDGTYHVVGYYQSGAGLTITPKSQSVSITTGDYMIGASTQTIAVQAGDNTQGSPIVSASNTVLGDSVYVSNSHANVNILAGDTVTIVNAGSAGFPPLGIPAGTPIVAWSFSGRTPQTLDIGSRLVVAGASVAGSNDTWDIIAIDSSNRYITPIYNSTRSNTLVPGGTFTHAGTFSLTSLTAYVVSDLAPFITAQTERYFLLPAATLTVTGSSHGNNISGVHPQRVFYEQPGPNYLSYGGGLWGGIWVLTGSQSAAIDTFTAVLSPSSPNAWSFSSGQFDSSYIGTDLVVSANPAVASNVGTFPVTSTPFATTLVTSGATALIAQVFSYPLPTIEIDLTTQIAYTFKLQSLTLDYTFQGALVSVQGADTVNNGVYKITQINSDGTFIAQPQNGLANQVNEAFTGAQTVTIFFNNNIAPEFQPCWFLVPLTGSQPVTGRFEYGTAYADWRIEGDTTLGPNQYPFSVSSPVSTPAGIQVVLPYRAQSVTAAVPLATQAGQIQAAQTIAESTVGLKAFTLSNDVGQAYANSGELLIPGPMASTFTDSGFHEDNINLALEAPFLVSQTVATSGQLSLTAGAKYFYVAVAEYTDENGNRIFSIPSPALEVAMALSNNVSVIGGRVLFPLSTTGQPIANAYGPTTRQVTISIYRSAWINGLNTPDHYKITDDLNVNGLAPVSATNSSGFSFPSSVTWQYIDQNPDVSITASEILYTDKSFLPRFPAPAFSTGLASWKNREWVIGYDGAVWMSGEKTEGDAIWFFPGFRYVFPSEDRPVGLGALEDFLVVLCENSIWYIPAVTFPDATGANGTLPTPLPIPGCQNGSVNGFALTLRDGVAYDSTAGGIWIITRNLQNLWLSQPVQDSLISSVTGLAFDRNQRLLVQQEGSQTVCVYDEVVKAWYLWNTPTQGSLLTTYRGQAAYQDSATVNLVTPGQTIDTIAGTTYPIAPDITLAPFSFANVRGLKRVWEFQVVGQYLGPHNLNVQLSYPEDDQPTTIYLPFVASSTEPYIYPFNPLMEEASQFGVRVYADFGGVDSPGLSFALEMISAEVGVDPAGINTRPASVRLTAKT